MLNTDTFNLYTVGKHLATEIKYNIAWDRQQLTNLVCAKYAYDFVSTVDKSLLTYEEIQKINNLIKMLMK